MKPGTHTRSTHEEPRPQSLLVLHEAKGGVIGTQNPFQHCWPLHCAFVVHCRVMHSWPRQICAEVQSASVVQPGGRGSVSGTHSPERQREPCVQSVSLRQRSGTHSRKRQFNPLGQSALDMQLVDGTSFGRTHAPFKHTCGATHCAAVAQPGRGAQAPFTHV